MAADSVTRGALSGPGALGLVAVLAIAASATSLGNQFSFDDLHIVVNNAHVHSLAQPWLRFTERYWPPEAGVGLYRPVTILLYGIQWALGHGAPFVFHLASVLLYALAAVLFLLVARRLLPSGPALAAAVLWAVHPVHVEAVANIVGQSEIVTAIALFAAILIYLSGRSRGALTLRQEAGIAALYLMACLSKEHGLVLPAILLGLEFTVLADHSHPVTLRRFYLSLAALGLAFFAVRTVVLGDLAGDLPPYWMSDISTGQRWLTMLAVVPHWIRLLLWPAHLQADYGPRELELATTFGVAQALGTMLLVSIGLLAWQLRRRQPVMSFGIVLAAIALLPTSNLLLPTGIALAERTLFLPSAGVCLALGGLTELLAFPYPRLTRLGLSAIVILGLGWSAWRQPVWRDNLTLFHQMTLDAPLSYRAHWGYGSMLFDAGQREKGFHELEVAHSLYNQDSGLILEMARRLRNVGACRAAVPLYRQALAVERSDELKSGTRTVMILCLFDLKDFATARAEARLGVASRLMASEFKDLERFADSAMAASGKTP